ncbi:PRC-barrel domain-containing protein (plasmid) [Lichenicola cladoniae]|uniref:PRC-barrel domain-containing protein n=1 Tax=Lichenicola cladoniae TaxID=1484109 RepID=A0A6M8HYA6_9PROT|nr:PRC-barrel domain-containing protein [Lichenicola cladoniae]NPD69820.1 PRC-barrel domain-containing protein [Acetobacteraceae bacterium]QKE93236.1 PRC-barrel domain-containing protein [Lichenicola cladoniae]
MASVDNPSETGGRVIAASKVSGTSVYSEAGEKLGNVYDVMLNKVSGKAEYAILSFGGFLGIGDKYHPLPWNQLKYEPRQGGYVINLSRDRLEGAPAYAASEMSVWDDLRGHDIDDYYGHGAGLAS